MGVKVVKFGGSSLADANQIKKAAAIIQADAQRRYVVPSAPGKRFQEDTKVTDMLYSCYELAEKGLDFQRQLEAIQKRYQEIIDGLGMELSLDSEFAEIADHFRKRAGKDYAASRGEYLNGKVIASYLQFPFIDAAEVIFFAPDGSLDDDKTNEKGTAYWFNEMLNSKTIHPYEYCLEKCIEIIDNHNSTHLEATKDGRNNMKKISR